tara:strand:+ start:252 stop:1013 length:762 start_codon:yes stop_codon:yes gene_type:complete
MAEEKQEIKFPTETIDLPSEGKVYDENHPLSSGKIEVKYMTAKEEDILTSQNLIKKGLVIDKLLNSLIVTKGVSAEDLLIGDKNALMVAARILAYGGEYRVDVTNPDTGESFQHTFDLTECKFKELLPDVDYSKNEFELELPVTKTNITFKLLLGKDENSITNELTSLKKIGKSAEVTTRLKHVITSVNGETNKSIISNFVDNMLSKESFFLRDEISKINPDINLTQEVDFEGETTTLDIPMSVEFFWPKART